MSLPLSGIRILDLTRVWAGPLGTRILGDLGAEVIKIEVAGLKGRGGPVKDMSESTIRALGVYPDHQPGERPWNRSAMFNDFNRNKKSVTIDLSHAVGRDLFKRLVVLGDVVIENYSPRVMKKFALDYEVLREINPQLIMISMPGYGMEGPYREHVAYGTSLEPQAGMSSLMGYPDAGPYKLGVAFPDPIAAMNAASAVLVALWHRYQTGHGQFIDLSQLDASISLVGEHIVGYGLSGELPQTLGNRHPNMAPHGVYPCRGEDRWLAISVSSGEEWRALCQVMGRHELVTDHEFADQLGRWHRQDRLDQIISDWTRTQDHVEAMHLLQNAGVSAGAVFDGEEMVKDPHLQERGFFWDIPHPAVGTFAYPGLPIHFSDIEIGPRLHAPLLGEHNEEILIGLLGLSQDDLAQLEKDGVIGIDPPSNN